MRNKGFTLIELIFVIAIILSISALMAPAMFNVRKKALVVSCQSNQRQIDIFLASYATENEGYIPRTGQDVEARNHVRKLRQPGTGIPSLKGLIKQLSFSDGGALKLLRCPADNGNLGQDYYPAYGTCWEAFGQSQQMNIEMFVDETAPWYNNNSDGPMFGANPVLRNDARNPSRYMVFSDMFSHWHNGIKHDDPSKAHYLNILYFDGHVAGQFFDNSLAARIFLNRNDVKRWWHDPLPE